MQESCSTTGSLCLRPPTSWYGKMPNYKTSSRKSTLPSGADVCLSVVFQTDRPTVIEYDDHEYLFEGFSLFSHTPLTNVRQL